MHAALENPARRATVRDPSSPASIHPDLMSIQVGIIGAGGMIRYHAEGFRQAGAEVVAVADVDPAAAARAAHALDLPRQFASAAAMIAACPDLDAVSIITPNKFHKPLAIEALQAGLHVFCEKPPALSAAEVREMIAAEQASGRRLMFNFNNRARPESSAMMDYIRDGTVGTIQSAQARWVRRTGIPGFGGWFTNQSLAGGGALIDLLHMVDLATYFMGCPEPAYVLARTFSDFIANPDFKGPWGIKDSNGPTDVESAAHGFITFKSGQALSFQISWAEMVRSESVSVCFQGTGAGGLVQRAFAVDGDDGSATDTCELYVQEHGRSVNRSIIVTPDESMGRRRSAANFIRAIRDEEPPLNTTSQALRLMQIIDATYESARAGRPVSIG
jgi:predicted dehydrogenase